jgi:Coenzyme PQQ synthesis protein D (PqqD)
VEYNGRGVLGVRSQDCEALLLSVATLWPTFPAREGKMEAPLTLHSVVAASSGQVSCPLGEESAILNLSSSIYYGLDSVGTMVWNMLRQPRSVGDIRDALLDEYDVDASRCERDLFELLLRMRDEGLVEVRVTPAP